MTRVIIAVAAAAAVAVAITGGAIAYASIPDAAGTGGSCRLGLSRFAMLLRPFLD